MGNYRSRLDIIADILLVASRRARKTQIMYQANLSYRLLTKYLAEIRKAYLVRYENEERRYMLTIKGKTFLKRYKEYSKSCKHVERKLDDINSKKTALEELCAFK
jgi:predicted transcriptional regulator